MDVIEAHARRLPLPSTMLGASILFSRGAGERAGETARPAWPRIRWTTSAGTFDDAGGGPRQAVRLTGLSDGFAFDDVVRLVSAEAGEPIDPDQEFGEVHISPGPIWPREALGARSGNGRVTRRAGPDRHRAPGRSLLYRELEGLLIANGGHVVKPAEGERWRELDLDHDWFVGYLSGVGMLTDGRVPRHTHRPDGMHMMLARDVPDLVVADHGFAGAAIEAGIETVSVADVNDPALIVAKAQGRTDIVVVMDDHVQPDAYWPCFQAAASAFPQVSGPQPN
jgi:hypothetical protein